MPTEAPPPSLAELRRRMRPFCERHPIAKLEVFGSVARGSATAESDVDLLVTLSRPAEVDELLQLAGEAEACAGARVDVVLRDRLELDSRAERRQHILSSAVCIYGD